MKRVANSYSGRTFAAQTYNPAAATKVFWWIPRIPNYVWLAMIILTVSALSLSTFTRSREIEREAKSSYSFIKTRVETAKGVNQQFKDQTERIKKNPRVAAQVAQEQLRLVRHNEIIVSVP